MVNELMLPGALQTSSKRFMISNGVGSLLKKKKVGEELGDSLGWEDGAALG
jgi:hypothetical protein